MDSWGEACPHLHIYRGACADCLTDVGWPDLSSIGRLEYRTRAALAGVSLRLYVYGRARGSRPAP